MGRSALTEDASVLVQPELLMRGDGCVLVTRVMVDVDGLCVTSFCWTARRTKGPGHPETWEGLSQHNTVVTREAPPSTYSATRR